MPNDESIAKVVYEDLVQLTFLCGRGLTLPVLMTRFLRTMAPRIPASALWLTTVDGVIAATDPRPPPAADAAVTGLRPVSLSEHGLAVMVLPEVALIADGVPPSATSQDVLALFARILALAWQAETVAVPALALDDYRAAKRGFQREWLSALLDRHVGNKAAAARAAGLSRVRLHQLVLLLKVRERPGAAEGEQGLDTEQ